MKRPAVALALATALGGCASFPMEQASVVPGTVSARPHGMNYKISALVESGDKRAPMYVYATDCDQRHGRILDGTQTYKELAEDAMIGGPAAKDKLFTKLCGEGIPMVDAMQSRETPEELAAKRQAMNQAMGAYLLQQAQRPLPPVIIAPPAPAPRAPINCYSNRIGNSVYTNCN